MGKVNSIQQHAPLVIPENWNGQEKRLVIQLEEILDDIYRRFGRLRLADLSGETRNRLIAIFTNGTDQVHSKDFDQQTVLDIDHTGIRMYTGLFTVDATDEKSYIRFGEDTDDPKFVLGIDGNILARNGNFESLFVNGEEVAVSRGTRLVVSDTQPEGNDILWVKPISSASQAAGSEPVTFTLQANANDKSAYGRALTMTNRYAGKIVGNCDYTLTFLLTNMSDTNMSVSGCTVDLVGKDANGNDESVRFGSVSTVLTPGGIYKFEVPLSNAANVLYGNTLTATAHMNVQSSLLRYASAMKLICSGMTGGTTPAETVKNVEIKYIT